MRLAFERLFVSVVCCVGLWHMGCSKPAPAQYATVTLKEDGSQFSGTVIRSEANSITMADSSGQTRTFLYNELRGNIQYGNPSTDKSSKSADASGPAPVAPVGTTSESPVTPVTQAVEFATGSLFPVRTSGILDSCCVPIYAMSVGLTDSDVKGPDGKVVIPAGSNVTMSLRELRKEDNRIRMTFELESADFLGHHYTFLSAKSPELGATVSYLGAQDGSQEAKTAGTNIHLEDQTYMAFKAQTPTILKPSE